MSQHKYAIPPEFQDKLTYHEPTDGRSDEEILASLTTYHAVNSEKNVWAFWHSGIESMPGWCKRNVINWVRLLDSSWTVRVLDAKAGSENYMLKYVPAEMLNDAMVGGKMDGPYSGQHSADLLRGACLVSHGGVFMDVGIVLFRDLDRICWNQLADPASPFQVSVPWMYGNIIANHFVASRKGDPFIKRWHELFVYLWKSRTNYAGLLESPLVSFGQSEGFDKSRASNFHWDFKVEASTVMEYITQVVCWSRVCMLQDPNDGFDGVEYWTKHVLIWDVLQENWAVEATLGFDGVGQKTFDLMKLKVDSDQDAPENRQARELVFRLLAQSSMQKVIHGKNLTNSINLGALWDDSPGKDCLPGTFGELLRYGSGHFRQTRPTIKYVEALKPPQILKKGLLEP